MTNMTDEQLCYAISEAREPRPPDRVGSGYAGTFGGSWFYIDNDRYPADWLSWQYAGRLLVEAGLTLARTQSGWRCGKLKHSYPPFIDFLYIDDSWEAEEYEQATRAIAEAYLEWYKNQKREDKNVQ